MKILRRSEYVPFSRSLAFCLVICFVNSIVFLQLAEPADKKMPEHIPMEKIIEFSLIDIKEKLNEAYQKNDRLSENNAVFRKDINYLKRIIEKLAIEKSQLSGQPLSFYYPQEHDRSGDAKDMKDRSHRSRVLIVHFEREINKLEEEIRLIEEKLDSEKFDIKRDLLIKAKTSGRQNLSNLQKKAKNLEQNSKAPRNAIISLQQKKITLEQQVADLESSIYTSY